MARPSARFGRNLDFIGVRPHDLSLVFAVLVARVVSTPDQHFPAADRDENIIFGGFRRRCTALPYRVPQSFKYLVMLKLSFAKVRHCLLEKVFTLDLKSKLGKSAVRCFMRVDRYREEVENGRRLHAHAARTGERFAADCEMFDAA
jgi:hypothetical protein